ncbi:MAG TPA: PfkB family carbohydrate kinase [Gemmatimonadaceae bacterium]|jgi:fructokinase
MKSRPVIVGLGEVLWDVYPGAARFGGAPANFACHAASFDAESWLASAVGVDEMGDRALDSLRQHGVESGCVARDPEHPTGRVDVSLDSLGRGAYEFADDSAWDHMPRSNALDSLARRCDAVCFGTLAQRSAQSRDTIQQFVKTTPSSALRMFDVNLRHQFYNAVIMNQSLELANSLKLNEEELPIVARLCGVDESTPADAMRALMDMYSLRLVALTRGPNGATLITEAEESTSPALATTVVDTVGAGDAFTAAVVIGFLAGMPLADVNAHANAVASFVCSRPGAVAALPEYLRTAAPAGNS